MLQGRIAPALLLSFFVAASASSAPRAPGGRAPAAAEGTAVSCRVGGATVEFLRFEDRRLLVSRSCQGPDGHLSCGAFEAFERASGFTAKDTDPGRQGAHLCKMTGGKVVPGKDEKQVETKFCRFPDGSLTDLGSLFGACAR